MRPFIELIKERFGDKELIGVEVGVGKGLHADLMVRHLNFEMLFLVDHWQPYYEDGRLIDGFVDEYEKVRQRFEKCTFVDIIKMDSLEAVKPFQDNSVDFIYIDANPSFETTTNNIDAWFPKLKKGGVFGGNNINWEETRRAVYLWWDSNGFSKQQWNYYEKNNEWMMWL